MSANVTRMCRLCAYCRAASSPIHGSRIPTPCDFNSNSTNCRREIGEPFTIAMAVLFASSREFDDGSGVSVGSLRSDRGTIGERPPLEGRLSTSETVSAGRRCDAHAQARSRHAAIRSLQRRSACDRGDRARLDRLSGVIMRSTRTTSPILEREASSVSVFRCAWVRSASGGWVACPPFGWHVRP